MVSEAASAVQTLRCDHCGRSVEETQHTRMTYHVDYYSAYTGEAELYSLVVDDGQRQATFLKLISRYDVITCVDCYGHADAQRERERRFRPERRDAARVERGE